MNHRRASSGSKSTTIVLPTVFWLFWMLLASTGLDHARRHDFLNLYAGAKLALEGQFARLHDPIVQLQMERQLVPDLPEVVPFVRPAFYALLLSPLALLSYQMAFWIWLLIQTAVAVGCTVWAVRRLSRDAALFASVYPPMALGIANGQDAPFMLALVIAAFILTRKDTRWAGAVLSLGLVKFHLFALWPLLLAVQRRWRMLGWFGLGAAALAGLSLFLSGFNGVRLYFELLLSRDIPRLSPSPDMNLNLTALLLNFGLDSPAVYGVLAVLTVLIAAVAARQAPLWKLFALAAAGSLLIVPHVYRYDATLLLLPLWCGMFLSSRRATRLASATLCLPLALFVPLRPPFHAIYPALLVVFFLAVATDPAREECPAGEEDLIGASGSNRAAPGSARCKAVRGVSE